MTAHSTSLTMSAPIEPRYRAIATEVAGKYAELAGCPPDDARAVQASVDAALDGFAGSAPAGATIEIALGSDAGEVAITVRCNGQSSVVRRSLPAGRS